MELAAILFFLWVIIASFFGLMDDDLADEPLRISDKTESVPASLVLSTFSSPLSIRPPSNGSCFIGTVLVIVAVLLLVCCRFRFLGN